MSDPGKWLQANVPEWPQLEIKERRAIRDFPILWALFELHATGQNGQRPNANPRRICESVAHLVALPAILGQLESARLHFAGRYFLNGHPTQAWHVLNVDGQYTVRVQTGLTAQNADNRQVLVALLLVINRLRNNYLHGEKPRYGFHDQYLNLGHANNVLMEVINLWPRPA